MRILNDFHISVERALSEISPRWRDYDGLVICGTHTPTNTEQMIRDIREARETGLPFLGICFGYQLAAIEYARNVLGIADATSEEYATEGTFVIRKRTALKVGLHEGESYWHHYEVIPILLEKWEKPANFFVSQFHPEYNSRKGSPHRLLLDFLKFAMNV